MSTAPDAEPILPLAVPPSDSNDVRIGTPGAVAGGFPAIVQTLRHLTAQTGLLRGTQALVALNQAGGVDCPGCAWPESSTENLEGALHERSALEFCENGAKAIAWEATRRTLDAAFFARHSLVELSQQSDFALGQHGRLTQPLFKARDASHYQPISWDQALARVGQALRALRSPDEAIFYTSGRTSNEAAFLYQLFVRLYGTNNLPDCSDLCHESSGVALRETIGVGKGTVQLADFEQADAIWVIGQNPGTNHPRMLSTLQRVRARGCQIVTINPLREPGLLRFKHPQQPEDLLGAGTELSTLHVPVCIGGDAALLKGVMKELLLAEARAPGTVLDRRFIDQHTDGFSVLQAGLQAQSFASLEQASGIPRSVMKQLADLQARSRRVIACWAMGLTQQKDSVATIQEVVNLLLLGGHIGRPGAGLCPVRGHSNVQGDRTMGIVEKPDPAFLQRLADRFQFTPPAAPGLDSVAAIHALHAGRAHVFVALGGNFLSATPDTEFTAEALRRCQLTVQISTKLHRGHLVTGQEALILPCLGRTDLDLQHGVPQIVSVENSMGIVHSSQGHLPPCAPTLRSEVAIVCGLAQATLSPSINQRLDWASLAASYDRVRDHIAAVVPGFADFNVRLRHKDGFLLPNLARQRQFPDGKARFTWHPVFSPWQALLPDQLLMMTVRSHDQFNTTIYGLDDRYRGVLGGRRVILMNPRDLAARQILSGQRVQITSHFRGQTRCADDFVAVEFDIPERCCATYFPEANVLIPLDSVADKSRTPTSKSVVVTVQPCLAPTRAHA